MNLKDAAKEFVDLVREGLKLSEVKMEATEVKTADGATLQIDGESVFITSDEGERVAAPDGDYTLEDGREIKVVDGRIVEVESETTEQTQEESNQIDMSKEEVAAMIDEKLAELKAELMKPEEKEEVEASKEEVKEEVKEDSKDAKIAELEAKLSAIEAAAKEEAEKEPELKGAPKEDVNLARVELSEMEGMSYEQKVMHQVSKLSNK